MFFGGIEGGATHSKLIICDQSGHTAATIHGPSTNHWLLGIAECAARIARMVVDGKLAAGCPPAQPLHSLGLCLSGCEQESTNSALEAELRTNHPSTALDYHVCSDTVGTVSTASARGGLCLIAGTGSNALLSNPDGGRFTCGGWGNMLADEGSAWWIAQRAIKTVFDHMDGLERSVHPVAVVWQCIQRHFEVSKRHDVLLHCYGSFQKCQFAKLCVLLAEAADAGDQLSGHLFAEAGRYLAKATMALVPFAAAELLQDGGLNVVCAGSVWNSWHLMRSGFAAELRRHGQTVSLRLVRLTQLMALGAVYVGADSVGYALPRDYARNYEVFEVFEVEDGGVGTDHAKGNSVLGG